MIDGHKRDVECKRERFCGRQPDDERPNEAWPCRDGERVDIAQGDLRMPERLIDHRQKLPDVGARSNLRHNATVALVQSDL
jgi:hypothetical protein